MLFKLQPDPPHPVAPSSDPPPLCPRPHQSPPLPLHRSTTFARHRRLGASGSGCSLISEPPRPPLFSGLLEFGSGLSRSRRPQRPPPSPPGYHCRSPCPTRAPLWRGERLQSGDCTSPTGSPGAAPCGPPRETEAGGARRRGPPGCATRPCFETNQTKAAHRSPEEATRGRATRCQGGRWRPRGSPAASCNPAGNPRSSAHAERALRERPAADGLRDAKRPSSLRRKQARARGEDRSTSVRCAAP